MKQTEAFQNLEKALHKLRKLHWNMEKAPNKLKMHCWYLFNHSSFSSNLTLSDYRLSRTNGLYWTWNSTKITRNCHQIKMGIPLRRHCPVWMLRLYSPNSANLNSVEFCPKMARDYRSWEYNKKLLDFCLNV